MAEDDPIGGATLAPSVERSEDDWSLAAQSSAAQSSAAQSSAAQSSAQSPAAQSPAAPELELPTARYQVLGRLGAGGQGTVYRVFDRHMERTLAMKVLRPLASVAARTRFRTETALTARLEHPGIVPIHDRGLTGDGRPWYTMQILEGVELGRVIAEQPLRRRLDVFVRACEAVAYAHRHGVVHRDLKPQNIMIGAFGEVRVLDWGLARRVGAVTPEAREGPAGAFTVDVTRAGALMGTPRYMAPEQLAGELTRIGPATDVYALGLILAQVLGQPPAGRSLPELIERRAVDLPPPGVGPAALRALCARATRHDPGARPADAGALADAVKTWLDGAEKRAQAAALVAEARAFEPQIAALRAEAQALDSRAAAVLDPIPSHAPIADKRPGWALSDAAAEARRAARLAEVKLRQTLQSALRLDPESADARAALTAHYRDRLLDAEAAHDTHGAAEFGALLLGHDAAANAEWLRGDGRLTLLTDPPGAAVTFSRYEERDRRLVAVPLGRVEATPIVDVPLAMGSYLLEIEHPGRCAVRYPVDITRHGRWDGVPPGAAEAYAIPLPEVGAIGQDARYVPASWCVIGGDREAMDPLPARRVWVDGFVIDRDPVTHADCLAWLNALLDAGREADAIRWAPRQDSGGRDSGGRHSGGRDGGGRDGGGRDGGEGDRVPVYRRDAGGRFVLGPAFGVEPAPDWPAVGMTWAGARALLATRGAGLPFSWQWEKAARGVDGRLFAWGDHFEPNWANTINTRPGRPAMGPIGQPASDVGPHGVRGLVGNVRELCADAYRRGGPSIVAGRPLPGEPAGPGDFIVVKGGSYGSGASACRVAGRFGMPRGVANAMVGFRGCRAL